MMPVMRGAPWAVPGRWAGKLGIHASKRMRVGGMMGIVLGVLRHDRHLVVGILLVFGVSGCAICGWISKHVRRA